MSKKTNLVYVFGDQLRYSACGYTGDVNARTPNIDKLAAQSKNFAGAVSGHPVCAPYRASLLTGKYTTSTGMVINEIRLNPSHRSFAHVLSENGYRTAYIGKWHMWANEWGAHDDPKNSFIPKGENRLGFDDVFKAFNFHHEYNDMYYHLDTSDKVTIKGYEPDGQTQICMDTIEEFHKSEKPFSIFLSIGTPHDPWEDWNVPQKYLDMFKDTKFSLPPNYKPDNDPYADDWAKLNEDERKELTRWMKVYYAMVANLDENIGKIMQKIDDLGIAEDTIFVFTSDHGEMFGAQGRRAKNIFYDEAVRVPFLMKWQGHIDKATRTDVPFNTVDIMPTLLSMMDLPIPEAVEGTNLAGAALGNSAYNKASFMQGTGATAKWEDGHEWRGVRSDRYTYAKFLSDGKEFLFDNAVDPYQMTNLIDSPAHKTEQDDLKQFMSDKMAEIGDKFRPSTWYEKNWTNDRKIFADITDG